MLAFSFRSFFFYLPGLRNVAAKGFVNGEEEELAGEDAYPEGPLPSGHDSLRKVKKTSSRSRVSNDTMSEQYFFFIYFKS